MVLLHPCAPLQALAVKVEEALGQQGARLGAAQQACDRAVGAVGDRVAELEERHGAALARKADMAEVRARAGALAPGAGRRSRRVARRGSQGSVPDLAGRGRARPAAGALCCPVRRGARAAALRTSTRRLGPLAHLCCQQQTLDLHLFGRLGGAGAQLPGVSDVSQHKGTKAKHTDGCVRCVVLCGVQVGRLLAESRVEVSVLRESLATRASAGALTALEGQVAGLALLPGRVDALARCTPVVVCVGGRWQGGGAGGRAGGGGRAARLLASGRGRRRASGDD